MATFLRSLPSDKMTSNKCLVGAAHFLSGFRGTVDSRIQETGELNQLGMRNILCVMNGTENEIQKTALRI